jgi:hypothetical protein
MDRPTRPAMVKLGSVPPREVIPRGTHRAVLCDEHIPRPASYVRRIEGDLVDQNIKSFRKPPFTLVYRDRGLQPGAQWPPQP